MRTLLSVLRSVLLSTALLAPALAAADDPLVVYSGRGEALVGELLKQFTADTGIEVDVRYNGTPQIATQLLAEGRQSPADVVFLQDSGYLGALASNETLAKLPADLVVRVDPRFRDDAGRWIGTSGRLRVLVYDSEALTPAQLPSSLADLADPRYRGMIGWAPGNGSFQAHVSALRHLWGEEQTREWLQAMQRNAPATYPRNSAQVQAVEAGEIDIGWVNHYYLHQLRKPGMRAANYSFPAGASADAGNVLMLSGIGITSHSKKREDAAALVRWLTGDRAQRYFSLENYEYPVRPGVPTHPDVPPIAELNLAEVRQSWLTDVGPTLQMLRELDLL